MYTEIVLDTDLASAEAFSDALVEAGALAATIEDANAGAVGEEPLFGEPGAEPRARGWVLSRIIALFDADAAIDDALAAAASVAGLVAVPPWTMRTVAATDWVRLTQSQFEPMRVGSRLWIVPSWHELPAGLAGDAVVLKLDPGLAFGTGAHATTRLCLAWLAQNLRADAAVIDYGCGSGILAIAAKKLGAGRVYGTDIDPQAIRASIDNARANGCDVVFSDAQARPDFCADVVIANILSNPLKVLAPHLAGLVAPSGSLVLSGVLARQTEEVIAAYRPWISLSVWDEDEGWACLAGEVTAQRPDDLEGRVGS